ncbi:MAG: Peptidase C60 sortase A and B, partial [candidate division WWE3 bacterium GW2011_GWB1_42_6]
ERNISADIIEVGLQTDGTLDTPKKWNEAGWYKKGAKPGEDGNVIINAHFDDNFGRPAAFWQLKNATVGDTVLLEDSLGRQYAYQIVDSLLVDINDPDRLKVLEDTDGKSELTLITCGGVWLPGKSTYDKRLVVKAELIDSL